MKTPLKSLSNNTKAQIIRIIDGILSVAILLFLFNAIALTTSFYSPNVNYFFVYVLMAASSLIPAFSAQKDRLTLVKSLCFAAVLTAAGITVLIADLCIISIIVMLEAFLLVILTNRVTAIIAKRKLRNRLINILLSLAIVLLMLSTPFIKEDRAEEYLLIQAILIAGRALGHIISISFSQMRFSVLRKILRKTFAAEILFGLVLLIIAFSFVFRALEPDIESYFDALWYCFAVVTTIGFGDLTVTSPFLRVLSMILGVYGIVVVALITSIIVNFYNEVKDEADEKEDAPAELTDQTDDREKSAAASEKDSGKPE